MQGIQIVLVCILTMVLASIMGFMIALGLIGLLTGVGVGVVGAVALHVMGNTSSDLLMFASGVGLSCMMSTGLIDTYTPCPVGQWHYTTGQTIIGLLCLLACLLQYFALPNPLLSAFFIISHYFLSCPYTQCWDLNTL